MLFGFTLEQICQLLVIFQSMIGFAQLCLELINFALEFAQRRAGVCWRDELARLEGAVCFANSAVVPDAEFAGDFQAIERFAVAGAELMGRFVSLNAQRMEQADNISIKLDFTAQLVKQVGLGGLGIKFDGSTAGKILR